MFSEGTHASGPRLFGEGARERVLVPSEKISALRIWRGPLGSSSTRALVTAGEGRERKEGQICAL